MTFTMQFFDAKNFVFCIINNIFARTLYTYMFRFEI